MSKKDAYWFTHDCTASQDPKMLDMKVDYGREGQGLYWEIIETLRTQTGYKLPMNRQTFRALDSKQSKRDKIKSETFINDCIELFNLFETDGQNFWSPSLISRMQPWEETKIKRAEAGRKGGMASAITRKKSSIADVF